MSGSIMKMNNPEMSYNRLTAVEAFSVCIPDMFMAHGVSGHRGRLFRC